MTEETGMSYRWVMKYLPDEYKDENQSKRAASGARRAAEEGELSILSKPPENRFLEISKYANSKYAIYTVSKALHNDIEKVANTLKIEASILVQNIIEKKIRRLLTLKKKDVKDIVVGSSES